MALIAADMGWTRWTRATLARLGDQSIPDFQPHVPPNCAVGKRPLVRERSRLTRKTALRAAGREDRKRQPATAPRFQVRPLAHRSGALTAWIRARGALRVGDTLAPVHPRSNPPWQTAKPVCGVSSRLQRAKTAATPAASRAASRAGYCREIAPLAHWPAGILRKYNTECRRGIREHI